MHTVSLSSAMSKYRRDKTLAAEMEVDVAEAGKTSPRKLKSKEESPAQQQPKKKKKRQQTDTDRAAPLGDHRPKLSLMYRAIVGASNDDDDDERNKVQHRNTISINSESSAASTVSSIESMLEARRENPEEILLALGFGGSGYHLGASLGAANGPEANNCDLLARIPGRFFEQPSSAKGIDLRDMLEARETLLMARQNNLLLNLNQVNQQSFQLGAQRFRAVEQPRGHETMNSEHDDDKVEENESDVAKKANHLGDHTIPTSVVVVTPPLDDDLDDDDQDDDDEQVLHNFPDLRANAALFEFRPPGTAATSKSSSTKSSNMNLFTPKLPAVSLAVPNASGGGGVQQQQPRKLSCPEIFESDSLSIERLLAAAAAKRNCAGSSHSLHTTNNMTVRPARFSYIDFPWRSSSSGGGGLGDRRMSSILPTEYERSTMRSPTLSAGQHLAAGVEDLFAATTFGSGGHLPRSRSQTQSQLTIEQLLQLQLAPLDTKVSMSYAVETALLVSIQSLRLSMDFYRFFSSRQQQFFGRQPVVSETTTTTTTNKVVETEEKSTETTSAYSSSERRQLLHDRQRLIFQNLYLDVLEVETILYDSLVKFRHSAADWATFALNYHRMLQKAINKIVAIQEALAKFRSSDELQQ